MEKPSNHHACSEIRGCINRSKMALNWNNQIEETQNIVFLIFIAIRKATIRPNRQFVPIDNSSQSTIRPKRQFVPIDNSSQATIRPKRQFVPNSKKRQFVPNSKKRQFVPF